MGKPALLAVEAARIQTFLTAGGRLRDLAGGSALVEAIGEEDGLLGQALKACGLKPVEPAELKGQPPGPGSFMLLRNSGGAVHGLAPDTESARRLIETLSLAVLEELPGLNLLASHVDLEGWDSAAFAAAWEKLRLHLAGQKQEPRGRTQFTPPFVARCEATGEAASGRDNNNRRLADNPKLLRESADMANSRLHGRFKAAVGDRQFPLDVDDLSGEDGGYLAVVHLDGNDIGRMLRRSGSREQDINSLLTHRRELSAGLAALSEAPARAVVQHFSGMIDGDFMEAADGRWRLRLARGFLPFRPLVMGGDDLTLVCEGRIAFPLVIQLLTEFEKLSKDVAGPLGAADGVVHACAGVAIVKKHYPFAKAYELAEDLTRLAKRKARRESGSCIDFEVVTATQHTAPEVSRGLHGIGKTRRSPHRGLTCRPYLLRDFEKLMEDAWTIHTCLPGRQVRAIADAAMDSIESADAALHHLLSQLDRGLAGLPHAMSREELRSFLGGESIFRGESTHWHDLLEVGRFFNRVEVADSDLVQSARGEA